MIYTALTNRAMRIAYEAHAGQVDKCGTPYVFHPYHLAEQMPDEITTCVALLHDVVEDTPVTFEDLEREFPPEVTDALRLLTHDPRRARTTTTWMPSSPTRSPARSSVSISCTIWTRRGSGATGSLTRQRSSKGANATAPLSRSWTKPSGSARRPCSYKIRRFLHLMVFSPIRSPDVNESPEEVFAPQLPRELCCEFYS